MKLKQASVVVFTNPEDDTKYLAICRRNDNTKWGFPGGKIDPGESSVETASREIGEELGVLIETEDLDPLHTGPDTADFWTTTYWFGPLDRTIDRLVLEPGFEVKWMTEEELVNPMISPYALYNRDALNALRKMKHLASK